MSAGAAIDNIAALVADAQTHHAAQRMERACAAIDAAASRAPADPQIAFMQAQFAYESWRPSVALFERALSLAPGQREVVHNFILALQSEGQVDRAEKLLIALLGRDPGWIEGQARLTTLRVTRGDADFARGYAAGCITQPGNLALHLAWFHRLATVRDWDKADKVLKLAEARFPGRQAVGLARAYYDCEAGIAAAGEGAFAGLEAVDDPGFDLLRVRHHLRHGDPARALVLAEPRLATPDAPQFWPYCSLTWRLTGDPRHDWLEGEPGFACALDLGWDARALVELAIFLRELHRMDAPYPEQSVRGGTQTDRNLLLHHAPVIARLRTDIAAKVSAWRDALPPTDSAHPLLARKPAAIRFSGSWSVRLGSGGHHSAHTHPQGWISSALFVALPDTMGPGHAGELAIGMPPPELGLGLEPRQHIRPAPGRLALFPSTTWHGTVPFEGEERLTLAFDVAPRTPIKRNRNGS